MLKKIFVLGFFALLVSSMSHADITIKSTKAYKRINELNLSQETKNKIEKIADDHEAQLKELRPGLRAKRKEMKTELKKENPDYAILESINNSLYDLKKKENLIRVHYQYELSKVLTIQQRKDLMKRRSSKVKKAKN